MIPAFNNLNEREQWMVILCGLFLIFYVYCALLYLPLAQKLEHKKLQLQDKSQTLTWMNTVKAHYKRPKTKESLDGSQLLTVLTTNLKQSEIKKFNYQLQQTSAGDIQLSFESVPFNQFILWFHQLNQNYTMILKQLQVERTTTPGLVSLSTLLSARQD